ncbi:GPW/gp25 family protein [Aliikangiella maris]|uniref:GPW/gp25 family protein n=2 Tax=Aliikangiella maris TaxID=3162458 RepID=A0ABV3MJX0_9GAMM
MSQSNRLPKAPIGWPLLVTPVNGELHFPTLEESIKQSIKVILLTVKGTLLLHAEFGAGLKNFLHQPNQLVTRRRIQDAIVDSLTQWEPRIVLQNVLVNEIEEQPDAIRIEIFYVIKRTGTREEVKLTMNLGS